MAFAFGFDDDLFEESNTRPDKPSNPYDAKQCEDLWFMKGSDKGDDALHRFVHQGDVLFHQHQWKEALQPYHTAIKKTPKKNNTVYRMLCESVARCYVHLENEQLAKEYALKMVDDSQNDDHRLTAYSLMATVYQQFDNTKEEILCLQRCVQYHQLNVIFWFRLANAYLTLSKSTNSTSHLNEAAKLKSRKQQGSVCNCITHFERTNKETCQHAQPPTPSPHCSSPINHSNSTKENSTSCKDTGASQNYKNDKTDAHSNAMFNSSGSRTVSTSDLSNGERPSLAGDASEELCASSNSGGRSSQPVGHGNQSRQDICGIDGGARTSHNKDGGHGQQADEARTCQPQLASHTTHKTEEICTTTCEGITSQPEGVGHGNQNQNETCSDINAKNETNVEIGCGLINGESTEACGICMCAVQDGLRQVEEEEASLPLSTLFAIGCFARCSFLLGTVHDSVSSFLKKKNQDLQIEIKKVLESLDVDQSIIQQVDQHTEDVVYGRIRNSDERPRDEDNSNSSTNNVVVLTGEVFERKWFPWAL